MQLLILFISPLPLSFHAWIKSSHSHDAAGSQLAPITEPGVGNFHLGTLLQWSGQTSKHNNHYHRQHHHPQQPHHHRNHEHHYHHHE